MVMLRFLLAMLTVFSSTFSQSAQCETVPLFKEYDGQIYVRYLPTQIMHGQKVTLTIRGENLNQDFEKINWQAVDQHFIRYETDIGFDRIKITLYPIKSGTLTLPAIRAGKIVIPETIIQVRDNPEVSIEWQAPEQHAVSHQIVYWHARVLLNNSANSASMEARPMLDPNSPAQTLLTQQIEALPVASKLVAEQQKAEHLIARYQIAAIQADNKERIRLHSPAVVIKNTTNQRWFFFDTPVTITPYPLPNFLPITMAVGQLSAETKPVSFWQTTGELTYLETTLIGHNMDANYLQTIANQYNQQAISQTDITWLANSKEVTTAITGKGEQSTLVFRLPYQVARSGWHYMPAINLPYFNPNTAKIQYLTLAEQQFITLPTMVYYILFLLAAFVALLFSIGFWQFVRAQWYKLKLKQQLRHSQNAADIWQALRNWQASHLGFKENHEENQPSIAQWSFWYQTAYQTNEPPWLNTLNLLFYGDNTKHSPDMALVQQEILAWYRTIPQRSLIKYFAANNHIHK